MPTRCLPNEEGADGSTVTNRGKAAEMALAVVIREAAMSADSALCEVVEQQAGANKVVLAYPRIVFWGIAGPLHVEPAVTILGIVEGIEDLVDFVFLSGRAPGIVVRGEGQR